MHTCKNFSATRIWQKKLSIKFSTPGCYRYTGFCFFSNVNAQPKIVITKTG